jgi:hypothetical protein
VPENTSRILDHANIGGHVSLLILDERNILALPRIVEQTPEVIESSETPIALVSSETVGCN